MFRMFTDFDMGTLDPQKLCDVTRVASQLSRNGQYALDKIYQTKYTEQNIPYQLKTN